MKAKRRRKALRPIAAPFVVAPPTGTRIRTRLRPSTGEAAVLAQVGAFLGGLYRADLARRVRLGNVSGKDAQRARRKRELTAVTTSRWAGSITRTAEDQYQLGMRALKADVSSLSKALTVLEGRIGAPVGGRAGRTFGYASRRERAAKQQRRQAVAARHTAARDRLADGRPAIVAGGRRLAKTRHRLGSAGLTAAQWRARWDASRMFLTADGETGVPHGNYTITVTPGGVVSIALPSQLKHLANAGRGRYRLTEPVAFTHRAGQWADRVTADRSVRYDIRFDAVRGRWYLDASWTVPAYTPGLDALAGGRLLGIDLNADHLAAHVIDAHGNPVGAPITIPLDLSGPASQRDGRLRAAISHALHLAHLHGCPAIAVENLGFADARATGRETLGRGARQAVPAHGRRDPHRTVPGPSRRHGLHRRDRSDRRRPRIHLQMGRPALETRPHQQDSHRDPASRRRGGDRTTRPRLHGAATVRCHPDTTSGSCPGNYRPGRTPHHGRQGTTRPGRDGTHHTRGQDAPGPDQKPRRSPASKTAREAPDPRSGPTH
ncbi:hypothetical protein [Actinoplanes sp. L3-i22]|uniref:hypothetical protein n=1 Tax=Actinoplanes sp. L3-i22 TaxID=2836373 RepID=UPI001C785372|nr:hypothetical protein [Actinoplanes sp. L3-i22]BCY09379.1 hypothetical protein L3i22_044670 [Actinoplanes sp. L3-i22]